jgi:Helix-turn-helix domain
MTPEQLLREAHVELEQAELLLEVAIVAQRLKRCPETIRRYIRRGMLKATRVPIPRSRGGNYLVREADVLAFIVATGSNFTLHIK